MKEEWKSTKSFYDSFLRRKAQRPARIETVCQKKPRLTRESNPACQDRNLLLYRLRYHRCQALRTCYDDALLSFVNCPFQPKLLSKSPTSSPTSSPIGEIDEDDSATTSTSPLSRDGDDKNDAKKVEENEMEKSRIQERPLPDLPDKR